MQIAWQMYNYDITQKMVPILVGEANFKNDLIAKCLRF